MMMSKITFFELRAFPIFALIAALSRTFLTPFPGFAQMESGGPITSHSERAMPLHGMPAFSKTRLESGSVGFGHTR